MAYRKVYLRIHTQGYSTGWSSDADRSAFKEESRRLFQELGWMIRETLCGNRDRFSRRGVVVLAMPTKSGGSEVL